jgi:opacity protein-like surface antigen
MFQGGGGFATSPKFALIFNFLLEDVGIGAAARPVQSSQLAHGSVKFYSTMFEPTYVAHSFRHFNIYGLGGFGWLRRSVKFTGYETDVTHPGGFSIAGGSSSDSGGFDAGGGINYSPRGSMRIFLEARYLRGLASNSETALVPLTLGIRW